MEASRIKNALDGEHHSFAVTRREIFPSWVSSFPPQTFSLGISFVFGSVGAAREQLDALL
jgi:hypothetical protein